MNQLKGHINNLQQYEGLILLDIGLGSTSVKSILLGDDDKHYKIGNSVHILFKETELIISKNKTDLISLQNQFRCEIIAIEKGKLLSQIELKFGDFSLTSIITSLSSDRLDLKIGDLVTALVKTNEIMVSVC